MPAGFSVSAASTALGHGRVGAGGQRLQQRRVLQRLRDQLLGAVLAVHVGQQVGQLGARFEQLAAARRPGARCARAKSSMLSKVMSTFIWPSPVSVLGTWKATRGLIDFMRVIEVVDVHRHELALGEIGHRIDLLAREVGDHAHHERQLDLAFAAVDLDVVLDLHPRRAVARDELLTTVSDTVVCHIASS